MNDILSIKGKTIDNVSVIDHKDGSFVFLVLDFTDGTSIKFSSTDALPDDQHCHWHTHSIDYKLK